MYGSSLFENVRFETTHTRTCTHILVLGTVENKKINGEKMAGPAVVVEDEEKGTVALVLYALYVIRVYFANGYNNVGEIFSESKYTYS